jgi:N-acetylglucosamine-6-phosphate deacetylase
VSLPGSPYLAGSALTLDRAIANAVRFAGVSIGQAVKMASTIPAEYLGEVPAGTVSAYWDESGHELRVVSVRE